MKGLLSINNYYYRRGGAETVFFEHNQILEKSGWMVTPFAMQHPKNLASVWSEYFVKEIQVDHNYSIAGKLKRIPKVIYSKESQHNLEKLINKTHPNIAHAHNIYHHISPSIFPTLKRRGIPIILTLHDLKLICPAYTMITHDGICERCKKDKFYNIIRHRCIKNSLSLSTIIYIENVVNRLLGSYSKNINYFIVPSKFYRNKMIEWGWTPKRFIYIPNFINTNNYVPNYTPGIYFLYFGRLRVQKGISTLIRAAALSGIPLKIAGTGPESLTLRKLADATGAKVSFIGFLSGKALHDQVRGARATVLPSEWYENAPMSIMESYALGTPVIGAAIGGIPELIKNDVTGSVFTSGDVHNLATILSHYAAMPDQRLVEMGRAGRDWLQQQFSENHYREQILELYAKV